LPSPSISLTDGASPFGAAGAAGAGAAGGVAGAGVGFDGAAAGAGAGFGLIIGSAILFLCFYFLFFCFGY
jgi:hypothetical protein